jgi:recombination protein RecT
MTSNGTVNTETARAALAKREPETPLEMAKSDLAKMRSQFELVLPASIPAERLVRVLQTVVTLNPDLADPRCRRSLLGSAMTIAQLGLDPTPAIGHAYIIPFKDKGTPVATFVLGYKGAIFLANDNGVHLKSYAIHENDEYEVQLGTEAFIKHKLPPFGIDRGQAIAYYCVATFADGSPCSFDVMSVPEIDRIRNGSPGKNSPAWRNHYDEQAKKTVLKRHSKSVPLGVKASVAMAHDGTPRTDTTATVIDDVPDYSEDRPENVDDNGVIEAEIACETCGGFGDHDLEMHRDAKVPVPS